MAITVKKLSTNPRFGEPGMTEIEYSITFDTTYAATNGESLAFGTVTNFKSYVRYMLVTKPASKTNNIYWAVLNGSTASAAKLKLYRLSQTSNTNKTVKWASVTTGQDMSGVKMRAIFGGY